MAAWLIMVQADTTMPTVNGTIFCFIRVTIINIHHIIKTKMSGNWTIGDIPTIQNQTENTCPKKSAIPVADGQVRYQ